MLSAAACNGIKPGESTKPSTGGDSSDFSAGKVGETLGAWTKGTLDIHFINTGRGESAFYILPDGTTMLVDMAGSLLADEDADGKYPTAPRPNAQTSSAEVIVNYINHFTSPESKGHIDYAVLTHFHEDHMGSYLSTLPSGGDGTFKMTSMCEIGTRIPFRHYLDRAYPDYDYPYDLTDAKYTNIKNFVKWTVSVNGTKAAAFDAGASDQITLLYDAASYPSFNIQNLSANGRYWTGSGHNSVMKMPESYPDKVGVPNENCFSCAFRLKYGRFDFFTAGDHQYTGRSTFSYFDSEAPMAQVMSKVDVAKANHHGTTNANSTGQMNVLKPTVWIANIWRDVQPNAATVKNVIDANPSVDIYLTNFCDVNVPNFTEAQKARFVSTQGHVVVRVNKTGTVYYVYALDDSDMQYRITKISKYTSY
ncbi:MAG: hypothetical protein LKK08_01165 [Bacteroidales bacterium]|nr:hypothetical protein [Bacteroidales bacterium]MCI2144852.1 hypothetical protein [Bacteroidales bacterium]